MSVTEIKSFGKIPDSMELPNFVEIQTNSYDQFLQAGIPIRKRKTTGMEAVFKECFPIDSFDGTCRLEYVSYELGKPKYSIAECHKRAMTFAAPLKVKLRLIRQGEQKEQEVYIGELPLMTPTGTFIINGAERVVVSQLHRSPGISFEKSIHATSGKTIYSVRIIPYRGAWVEFEADPSSNVLYAYIDRRKKILASVLLRAVGYSKSLDFLSALYETEKVADLPKASYTSLTGRVLADDVVHPVTNELLAKAGLRLDKALLDVFIESNVSEILLLKIDTDDELIANTLERDPFSTKEDAQLAIYKRLRPGDPPTAESAEDLITKLFFDPQRYDLGEVGRFMVNRKLKTETSAKQCTLIAEDFISAVQSVINLRNGVKSVDDIDHLGNRRVRSVGELLQNQFRVGLARMKRSALERMSIYSMESVMPHNLINPKLLSTTIKDFFGRSQLSQFMDQTNPLAELTHKRRLSALGPGGLSRERAGFEVRDVHPSHYGRLCPIETPEGPNIGLIASLSTFARVSRMGFLETPYRKVINGKVTNQIDYLSADKEDEFHVAQANAKLDEGGNFVDERINCRFKSDYPKVPKEQIDYMDVSAKQLVSVAASLIPFLEHDDANRALMGSNMQRQAVPLLEPEAPLVSTGVEMKTAVDSGATVTSKTRGTVKKVSSDEIVVDDIVYRLKKFERSNAGTCINQRPLVSVGQKVKLGDILADGAATKDGQLALGRNILVSFMPWNGYNFEDAIIVSQRLIRDDVYTSIHIDEFDVDARETKLGSEEITRDIPNVGEDALKNLDEEGIIRIGAEVRPGDILVGKVTPKSETELSP